MINGENIKLRELRKEDIASINRWRNNLQNRMLTQGFRGPVTIEIESEWLNNVLNNKGNRDIYFGIEKYNESHLIGIIQLNEIDYISRIATCGILIGELEDRGKGVGVEAVRAILYYAFFVLNLRKIITYIVDSNHQALKVQEKVGKVWKEGRLKEHYYFNGQYVDLHIQSYFKEDFVDLINEYSCK